MTGDNVIRLDDLTPAQRALVLALIDAAREANERSADPPPPVRLLSVEQAAGLLGLGRTRTYEEIGAGRLKSFRVGRRRLVPESAVDEYIRALSE